MHDCEPVSSGDISSSLVTYQKFLVCIKSALNTKGKGEEVLGPRSRTSDITACSAAARFAIFRWPDVRKLASEPLLSDKPQLFLRVEMSMEHCHFKADLGPVCEKYDFGSPSVANTRTVGFLLEMVCQIPVILCSTVSVMILTSICVCVASRLICRLTPGWR